MAKKATKTKVSKSAKIRELLAQGKTVQQVAKKLGVKPTYVYAVRWQAKNKATKKPAKKAKTNGKTAPKKVAKKAAPRNQKVIENLKTELDMTHNQLIDKNEQIRKLESLLAQAEAKPFDLREFLDEGNVSFSEGRIIELLMEDVYEPKANVERLETARDYLESLLDRAEATVRAYVEE